MVLFESGPIPDPDPITGCRITIVLATHYVAKDPVRIRIWLPVVNQTYIYIKYKKKYAHHVIEICVIK